MSELETFTELTARQKKFVEEYLIDEDPTAAALRAGYSVKSAKSIGYSLLKHPLVSSELERINKNSLERIGITKDRVLQELAIIAFANVQDILTQDEEGNTRINLKYLPRKVAAAITEVNVETSTGRTTVVKHKLKLADKLNALDKIGKYLNMWKEQVDHNVTLTLEQLVEKSFTKNKDVIEGEMIEIPQLTQ